MTRPLLLLDVDGPLNPFDAAGCPDGYTGHRYTPPWLLQAQLPPTILLNADHGPALQALPYELTWCTTWGDEANEFIGPRIGLPELPVLPLGSMAPRQDRTFWKTWPVLKHCAGRPFAWVDDEISDIDRQCVTARHDDEALLLPVSARIGLTMTDFDMLRSWAEQLP